MADVVSRGVRFYVQQLGTGDHVMAFVHGLVFDNLSSFYFTLAKPLRPHARLVLYDLRGHGRSEQPPDGYTVEDMALDLAGLLEVLGYGDRRVTVVGNSFGGLVALVFALRFPERTAGVVLIDAQVGDHSFGPRVSESLGLTGEARDRKVEEMFGHWFARHNVEGEPDSDALGMRQLFDRTLSRRRRPLQRVAERLVHDTTLAADLEGTPPLTDDALRGIRAPVLAFYGEGSDLRAEGERVARLLPDCRLEIFAGGAHLILFTDTDRLAAGITDWLDRNGKGTGSGAS
jgi:pimeloyl-ACP methyl ester carboxylesterase